MRSVNLSNEVPQLPISILQPIDMLRIDLVQIADPAPAPFNDDCGKLDFVLKDVDVQHHSDIPSALFSLLSIYQIEVPPFFQNTPRALCDVTRSRTK